MTWKSVFNWKSLLSLAICLCHAGFFSFTSIKCNPQSFGREKLVYFYSPKTFIIWICWCHRRTSVVEFFSELKISGHEEICRDRSASSINRCQDDHQIEVRGLRKDDARTEDMRTRDEKRDIVRKGIQVNFPNEKNEEVSFYLYERRIYMSQEIFSVAWENERDREREKKKKKDQQNSI